MRLRKRIIVLLRIALLGVAVFVVATPKSAAPVAISIVSIAEGQDRKRVSVEFLRLNATARFAEAHELQIRADGTRASGSVNGIDIFAPGATLREWLAN